jgi:phage shock protein A
LREARVRQNAVATRLESAENRVRLREAYSGRRTEEAFENFEALERAADYAEGQADALLLGAPPRTLEEESAELRVAERVDAELEAMKARRIAA